MHRVLPPLVEWVNRNVERHSLVETSPFVAESSFPWHTTVESRWQVIRQELDALLAHREALANFQDISPDQRRITDDDRWKTYFFYAYGRRLKNNCDRCPWTADLLANVPGLRTAFFSVLAPGKHIPPHRANYRGVIRYHLGLKVPDPTERCGIRVGGQLAHWREGRDMLFDDTYLHEAWNDSDGDRVVLFADILRPMRFPHSQINRLVAWMIAGSPLVQKAMKNERDWERQFAQAHSDR